MRVGISRTLFVSNPRPLRTGLDCWTTKLHAGSRRATKKSGPSVRCSMDKTSIGIEPSQVQDTAVEAFWTVATTPDKAEIFNLEMQSDLPAVFNFFQIIREAFWTIGREADPSVFKEKIGNVTNFGLRVLYMDALNKLGQKRQTYGKVLSQTLQMERDMQIVSRETAALERGRNWEVEKRRMQEDAQGQSVGKRLLRMLQAGGTSDGDEESE